MVQLAQAGNDPLGQYRWQAGEPPPTAPAAPAPTEAAPESGQTDPLAQYRFQPGTYQAPEQHSYPYYFGKAMDDLVRSTADMATMGYADEFAAKMHELTGFGGQPADELHPGNDYQSVLRRERARDENIPLELQIPGQVVGGALSYSAVKPIIMATKAGQVLARLPNWAKATGIGGLFGALYSSGSAKEGDRLSSAEVGAPVGAGLALGTYGALKGLGKGMQGARDWWESKTNPEQYAKELIAQAFSKDQATANEARRQLAQLGLQGKIADLGGKPTPGGEIVGGENVRTLARGAAGVPDTRGRTGAYKLAIRAEGEGKRIRSAVSKYLRPADYFDDEARFLGKLQTIGEQYYQKAFEKFPTVRTDRYLTRMLKESPNIRAGIKAAAERAATLRAAGESKFVGPVDKELTEMARYARDLGKLDPSKLPREGVAKDFSLETWHQVRWGLEQVLKSSKYTNQQTGKVNSAGYPLQRLLKSLTRHLERLTGGERSLYRQARIRYGSEAEALDALRDGRNFFRMAPEEIKTRLSTLSDGARAAFRSGAARAIMDRVEKTQDQGQAANALFNKEVTRKQLRALDMGEEAWAKFSGTMRAEQRMGQTAAKVKGGASRPDLEMEDAGNFRRHLATAGAVAGSQSPFGHQLVTSRIARETVNRMFKISDDPRVLAYVGQKLFSGNPAEKQGMLDIVQAINAKTTSSQVRRNIMSRLLSASLGAGQAGRVPEAVGILSGEAGGNSGANQ